jgi:hypothetical protein
MSRAKFTISEALLSGRASAADVDNVAWLLEGGPQGRTAYMAGAAKRAAARVEQEALLVEWGHNVVRQPMSDVSYPADCGSRFD